VSTPLRPCSRTKTLEMQDDIRTAVEEQSVPLLRVALQRRHPCPGEHALHEAVRQAHVPAVRLLLQGHAEPNARCLCLERGCEFPLQLAVNCSNFLHASDRAQAVEMLLQAGARPSPRRGDDEANTPLHDAVRRGDIEVALLLLRHLADPNALNGFGETPIQLIVRPGGGDFVLATVARHMAEVLLNAGACPYPALQSATSTAVDPELLDLLQRWGAWWRCRMLAWIRSRGSGHPLCSMMPEILVQVSRFL
jgi:ankyrin repeat protein